MREAEMTSSWKENGNKWTKRLKLSHNLTSPQTLKAKTLQKLHNILPVKMQTLYLRGAPSAISMAVIPQDHRSLWRTENKMGQIYFQLPWNLWGCVKTANISWTSRQIFQLKQTQKWLKSVIFTGNDIRFVVVVAESRIIRTLEGITMSNNHRMQTF